VSEVWRSGHVNFSVRQMDAGLLPCGKSGEMSQWFYVVMS
jgi:hypothetical protein